MKSTYRNIIRESLRLLIINDEELIGRRLKEECINHKFAQYVESYIEEYNLNADLKVDLEYNKNKELNKSITNQQGKTIAIRPDILVHRRNTNRLNKFAIECKLGYSNKNDIKKLKYLLLHPFNYQATYSVNYLPALNHMLIKEYYKRLNEINVKKYWFHKDTYQLQLKNN